MSLIIEDFNRVSLAILPTPIHALDRLSRHFEGTRIWIKRDDLTGRGLGGNKLRKLEFLMGEALSQGADCVITAGAVQSNHCRQTAAAAAFLGLDCHLLLGGHPQNAEGNLLLDQILGAEIHWAGDARKGENLPSLVLELKEKGRKPYLIPYGGSNGIGALGFIAGYQELSLQLTALDLELDAIIFASSSGGTHSGLMLGAALSQTKTRILGISIDKGPEGEPSLSEHIQQITHEINSLLGVHDLEPQILLQDQFSHRPYGECGPLERDAIRCLAREEGLFLDPVYTGRAMGGLLELLQNGFFKKMKNILFWHTGGSPALFAYSRSMID